MTTTIKFERVVANCKHNEGRTSDFIYDWRVMEDGKHVATFERQGAQRLYHLVDLDGSEICRTIGESQGRPYTVVMKAKRQEDFLHVFHRAKERGIVPTPEQIEAKRLADQEWSRNYNAKLRTREEYTAGIDKLIDQLAAFPCTMQKGSADSIREITAEAQRLQTMREALK